ncbi:DUF2029 domain-containing protein [Streptomyces sp. SID8379]|nr:DUF2029 domain-containing protein [Streptomyces sp. SID8379]
MLAAAVLGLLVRLFIAASSPGPADVRFFHGFAGAIEKYGPVRVYAQDLPGLPVYNHPPATGLMLAAMTWAEQLGASFAFLIRLPASLGDVLACVVVFEIVRRRARLRSAVLCAVAVAASPVLIGVSGYHGNTDPAAVALALLAAHLLADRRLPLVAGVVAALAISVKLVPIVVVPALFVAALRGGRPTLLRFTAGFGGLLAALWGPVLLTVPMAFKENVLAYEGGGYRLWGLIRFMDWLGLPESAIGFARGDGHFLSVLACVALGLWLAWRRPDQAPAVVGLTMALLLLLSTASGAQYLAWAAAGLCAVGLWQGLAFNAVVGAVAWWAYAGPNAVVWPDPLLWLAAFGWLVLAAAIADGVRTTLRTAAPEGPRPAAAITAPRAEAAPESAASPTN